jgi:hypothetical protein
MRHTAIVALLTAVVAAGIAVGAQAQTHKSAKSKGTEAVADSKGNLHVPYAYKTTYQYLGSWAVAVDQGQGAKQLHVVYASPGTVTGYLKTGAFPAGTVLVKEVYMAATAPMSTGVVSHEGTLQGWFVMVKGDNARYSGNSLWGDGWGWSWFDAKNPVKTTSTDYKSDCKSCHIPAQSTDWIYVGGYPPLTK